MSIDDDTELTDLHTHAAVRTDVGSAVSLSTIIETMLRALPDPIFVVDRQGRFLYVGEVAMRLLDKPASAFIGNTVRDMGFPPEVAANIAAQMEQVFRTGQPRISTDIIPTILGPRWYDHQYSPMMDDRGDVAAMLCIAKDVTERVLLDAERIRRQDVQEARRETEDALREQQERYRLIVENAQEGIVLVGPDAAFDYVNPRMAQMLGCSAEELVGRSAYDFVFAEDVPEHRKTQARRKAGEAAQREVRLRRNDGSELWTLITSNPILDVEGRLIGVLGLHIDLTERKQAEAKLHESSHLLQRIAEVSPGIIHVFDLQERRNVFINRTVAAVLGYSPDNVQAMGAAVVSTLMHPEDLPRFEQHIAGVGTMSDDDIADFEYRMRDRAGTWHWFHSRDAVFLRDPSGNARQIIGMAMEITERKQTEEALRLATERFELALQGSNIVVFNQDLDLRYTWIYNPALGYNAEEVLGKLDSDLFERMEDAAVTEAIKREVIRTGIRQRQEVLVHSMGMDRYFDLLVDPLRDPARRIIGVTCVAIDLTERKQQEEQLKLYEKVVLNIQDAVLITEAESVDLPGPRILFVNPAFTRMTGYTAEEVIGQTPRLLQGPKSDRQQLDKIRTALKAWEPIRIELTNYRKDGSTFEVEFEIVPVADKTGWYTHWISVQRDHTEHKRQQQEIADLNVRLQRSVTESHHRIKNNLQVLNAIVDMQIADGRETVSADEFKRIGQHIRTLATIHDMLTLESKISADRDSISLRATLENIAPMLQVASGSRKFTLRAEEMTVSLKQAGALTLLVNELVSNALKHARGGIEVVLTSAATSSGSLSARLEVCDDGPGFPADFDPKMAASTGLELIESLGRWDLRGQIVYENRMEGGARVVVTFPLSATLS